MVMDTGNNEEEEYIILDEVWSEPEDDDYSGSEFISKGNNNYLYQNQDEQHDRDNSATPQGTGMKDCQSGGDGNHKTKQKTKNFSGLA